VNWKIQRDTAKRGYNPEQVKAELEKRKCDTEQFIRPQRAFADIVVQAHLPQCQKEGGEATVGISHMLRPTLPHPDLAPVLESTGGNGLRFELARDGDSKPVDLLEISGDIPENRAQRIENLLWDLIPEAAHMRENVGVFTNGENKPAISHPLALSQLFITYHIVKAAMGIHAI
jgi:phosphoribulokinase